MPTATFADHHFENQRFFGDYRARFADCFEEQLAALSGRGLAPPLSGEQVYDLLFLDGAVDQEAIRWAFSRLARHCPETETVLARCWLQLLEDFAAHLRERGATVLEDLERLSHLVVQYSRLLYDVYFEVSREISVAPPLIDRASDAHRRTMERFAAYPGRGPRQSGLMLHTYYRGIAVASEAELLQCDDDKVVLRLNRHVSVALLHMGYALLESPEHGGPLQAYAESVDLERREVTFSHLLPWAGPLERRDYVRVEPHRPIEARIRVANRQLIGRIIDLSIRAVAIYVRVDDTLPLTVGDALRLEVTLPVEAGRALSVSASGRALRIFHHELGDPRAHRVVVVVEADVQLENELLHYVNSRQSEILTELRETAAGD